MADPKNPATWTHEQAVKWIQEQCGGKIDPATLCPYESGIQLWYVQREVKEGEEREGSLFVSLSFYFLYSF